MSKADQDLIRGIKFPPNACGEVETAHPGYLGSQDTFYVGTLKGVGRVYQQTYVDTYCKVAHAKLYTTKTPITAADQQTSRWHIVIPSGETSTPSTKPFRPGMQRTRATRSRK